MSKQIVVEQYCDGWCVEVDGEYVLRRVDRDQLPADSHHRIVEE